MLYICVNICICLLHYHHHHCLFLKHLFLPCSARVRRLPRYEAYPYIPEHCPFRLQTEHFHVIFYTLSPSLPAPAPTLLPTASTFLQANTQSSPVFISNARMYIYICCCCVELHKMVASASPYFEVREYRYWNEKSLDFDICGMLEDIQVFALFKLH